MFWYNKGKIENRISGKFYPVPPQTMNEAKKSVPIQKLKEKKEEEESTSISVCKKDFSLYRKENNLFFYTLINYLNHF